MEMQYVRVKWRMVQQKKAITTCMMVYSVIDISIA